MLPIRDISTNVLRSYKKRYLEDMPLPPPSHWIAITREPRKKRDWWCFPKDARKGDLVFIYLIKTGIVSLERITSKPSLGSECGFYRLYQSKTVFVRTFDPLVSIPQIRCDKVLSDLGAARRNFQGTTFRVAPEHAHRILSKKGLRPVGSQKSKKLGA
jgi:hypothetical protein